MHILFSKPSFFSGQPPFPHLSVKMPQEFFARHSRTAWKFGNYHYFYWSDHTKPGYDKP